jgi:hypothetical protein
LPATDTSKIHATRFQFRFEPAGYAREGVWRPSAIKDGSVTDQVLFAITDRDLAVKAEQ